MTVRIISRPPEVPGDRQRHSLRGDGRVTGTDPSAAAVTISTSDTVVGQPAGASPQSHFRFEVDASSTTTAPGWDTVTVTGSNTAETLEGSFYSPPRTEDDFAYDADGNLTDDARWEYTWDGERSDQCGRIVDAGAAEARRVRSAMPRRPHQNRLIEMVTQGTATSVPKAKLAFAYDHMGRRIRKKVSSWVADEWQIDAHHLFAYDGWNPVMRIDAEDSGAVDQKYSWGLDLSGSEQGAGGVGGLLFVDDGSAVHAPAYDGNGNVMAKRAQLFTAWRICCAMACAHPTASAISGKGANIKTLTIDPAFR